MFKKALEKEHFSTVINIAINDKIKLDRLEYKKIFDLVRNMIRNDELIILSNIPLLLNKDENEFNNITLYTTHPRRTTTLLSNLLHDKIGKYVQMRSIIPNKEYDIIYNMRPLIKLYNVNKYKNISLSFLFNAVSIDGLSYFPPEIELMEIYHKLYLPNYFNEWTDLLEYEKLLYNKIKTIKKLDYKNISSSDMARLTNGSTNSSLKIGGSKCKLKSKIEISKLKKIMMKFLNNENYIIVGKSAHELIKKENLSLDDNIQIISENDIVVDYNAISIYLSKHTDFGIFYKKKNLYIPKDNRICRHTIFIKYPTSTLSGCKIIDKPFMDIYNCSSYELLPYINLTYDDINLKVGNLLVQSRFLLIDLWILRLLHCLKIIDDDKFLINKKYIFDTLEWLKKNMKMKFDDDYTGINYDEKIAQKIIISEKNIKKTSYYPELSMKKNRKYELIATSS